MKETMAANCQSTDSSNKEVRRCLPTHRHTRLNTKIIRQTQASERKSESKKDKARSHNKHQQPTENRSNGDDASTAYKKGISREMEGWGGQSKSLIVCWFRGKGEVE